MWAMVETLYQKRPVRHLRLVTLKPARSTLLCLLFSISAYRIRSTFQDIALPED